MKCRTRISKLRPLGLSRMSTLHELDVKLAVQSIAGPEAQINKIAISNSIIYKFCKFNSSDYLLVPQLSKTFRLLFTQGSRPRPKTI
jgi:hypothetical protein